MKHFIIILLSIVLGISIYINITNNTKLKESDQNFIAALDTIHKIRMDNDNLLYEKNIFILKESELEKLLDISNTEIKELKKKLNSSLQTIQNIKGSIIVDTIYTTDTIFYKNDSIMKINFSYKDEWLNLNGTTNIYPKISTTIDNINIPLNIQTGITTKNQIFVKTDNPYIYIKNIEGAAVKNDINFKQGLYIGIGAQYGIWNKNIDIGPQIGYGVIIKF